MKSIDTNIVSIKHKLRNNNINGLSYIIRRQNGKKVAREQDYMQSA